MTAPTNAPEHVDEPNLCSDRTGHATPWLWALRPSGQCSGRTFPVPARQLVHDHRMAEDANARKARLKALRAAAQEEVAAAPAQDPAVPSDEPQLKFRNYAVKDKKHIQFEPVPAAQPPKPAEPVEEEPAAEDAEQVPLSSYAGLT